MHFHLGKKHKVQKTTMTTVTATETLTTSVTATASKSMAMTATASKSMTMTTTTMAKSQPRVNMKSKLKEWWRSTYPAKSQQKRSQKLGHPLTLEILWRQRDDDAQRNSSSSSASSSSGSGMSNIVASLKVSIDFLVCIFWFV